MRIQNLRIENFRGFRRFEMENLGRINLIVGSNNSGKTTVLEAISILMAHGNPSNVWAALNRRREFMWVEVDRSLDVTRKFFEVRELFHGYDIQLGTRLRLSADSDAGHVQMIAEVNDGYSPRATTEGGVPYTGFPEEFGTPWNLSLSWENAEASRFEYPMSQSGLVSSVAITLAMRTVPANGPLQLVSSSALTIDDAAASLGGVVLTPEEDLVIDALRTIEPSIERIASVVPEKAPVGMALLHPASIVVRLKGMNNRIPIGSMGEGIWRMLGLALNTVNSRDGILLVDDIDTGLHHTVMQDMWRFLDSAAERYNVQVFATTHSRDCYESLAVICDDSDSEDGDVTIQRIEQGRETAVAYSERHIIAAARRSIEVR